MGQGIELPKSDTEVPQNPYQDLTETELGHCIDQCKKELRILEEKAFQKAADQVTSRDEVYHKGICDVRNSIFTLRCRVGQITEVLDGRADAAGQIDNGLVKEWKKMRIACSRIDKKLACPLEQISHTINDYRHAFPNEKSTFLKKLGQVSAVASIVTVLSSYFFGDDAKAKAIATGSGFVIGTVIVNLERAKDRTAPGRPLEAAAIRRIYSYLT